MILFDSEWAEHIAVAEATKSALREPFARVVAACAASLKGGGKLLFFGNGGSAADAQHLATEFTIRYKADRAAMAALALTTDTSALTAAGNDLGFEHIFSRQIEALGRRGDVAIGITTSGKSANIVKALSTARAMGLATVAFSGSGGGEAARVVDHALIVPSAVTARVQEMHITLGQMLCAALELELGLVKP
ncbi:MAG: SIS domain-containing protein [Alphaproteobacteria bacterium]|nr:SIS domain-containing protein [Alphaproteobacteria bacterium]